MAEKENEDWVDEVIDKLTPYEVVFEDVVLSVLIVATLIIIGASFTMVGNVPPDIAEVVHERAANFPKYGMFGRLKYAGEILYPFVVMLTLLTLAREAWKYRREKQISRGEEEIDHFFRKFTRSLSKVEMFLNRILVSFLGVMTSIAVLFALAIIFIPSPDKILFWITEPSMMAADSVLKWITMLALIIVAREGWLIMKRKRED